MSIDLPGFADASGETLDAILEAAAALAQEVLQPINLSGDHEGCTRHPDGSVTTRSVHQFGSAASRRASPHYDDQSEWFAQRRFRPR